MKGPIAVSVTIHVDTQGCAADLTQRFGNGKNMPLVHMPGEPVHHNHHRHLCAVLFRQLNLSIQSDAVIHNKHICSS